MLSKFIFDSKDIKTKKRTVVNYRLVDQSYTDLTTKGKTQNSRCWVRPLFRMEVKQMWGTLEQWGQGAKSWCEDYVFKLWKDVFKCEKNKTCGRVKKTKFESPDIPGMNVLSDRLTWIVCKVFLSCQPSISVRLRYWINSASISSSVLVSCLPSFCEVVPIGKKNIVNTMSGRTPE